MLRQLSKIDMILDRILAEKGVTFSDKSIAAIKNTATSFMENYAANPSYEFIFYWSEYPMGATHYKSLRKIDSIWNIDQYDYNETPGRKLTPQPNINDDNLLESFLGLLLAERTYS